MDDLLGGADEVFDRTDWEVESEFDFGVWDSGATRFKGRRLTLLVNHDIMFDVGHYKHNL